MFESAQFVFSILLLSLTTKLARKVLFELFFLISNSNSFGYYLYSLLYLPGTLIHELSHFFTASVLGVRTGNISIFPKKEDKRLKLGSVEIEKTDFIRSSIIGLAPFVVGSIALLYLASTLDIKGGIETLTSFFDLLSSSLTTTIVVKLYLLIAISNTLFTSKEDRRHWPVFIVISLIIYLAFVISGKTISLNHSSIDNAKIILLQLTGGFYLAIFLNLFIFLISTLLKIILSKLLKKKIVYRE